MLLQLATYRFLRMPSRKSLINRGNASSPGPNISVSACCAASLGRACNVKSSHNYIHTSSSILISNLVSPISISKRRLEYKPNLGYHPTFSFLNVLILYLYIVIFREIGCKCRQSQRWKKRSIWLVANKGFLPLCNAGNIIFTSCYQFFILQDTILT